jgi:hypothetical protein
MDGIRAQMLQQTVIPERPMYFPEYPPQGTMAIPFPIPFILCFGTPSN